MDNSTCQCAIGTKLVKIEFNEQDGYSLIPHTYHIEDIHEYGVTLFKTPKEAYTAIAQLRHIKKEQGKETSTL